MRIIAGIAKGMPLRAPHRGSVRPTSDRVREAIFSSLGDRVAGATALDLYAGTGALGLEAASRGAAHVTFVDDSRDALKVLRQNIDTFRQGREITCELTVICANLFAELGKLAAAPRRYTLVLADPPYGDTAQALLEQKDLPPLLAENGVLVLESGKRDPLIAPAPWTVLREAIYGDTRVSTLRAG
jgi:16S rRNA (guanine966-N2)-methyltransferase